MNIKTNLDEVEPELREFIPEYIKKRTLEYQDLLIAVEAQDFEQIEKVSHKSAGTAMNYGLSGLGELALELETAAIEKNTDTARKLVYQVQEYLAEVSNNLEL